MASVHIVHGGIDNGDLKFLLRAKKNRNLSRRSWVAPKAVKVGDTVVIFVSGYGFFATAIVNSDSHIRLDWTNRYGAAIKSIRLIEPPISLNTIKRLVPKLEWVKFPRSVTTLRMDIADDILKLIASRRRGDFIEFDENALEESSIDELRAIALMKSRPSLSKTEAKRIYHARSRAISLYVHARAQGICEGCSDPAPFLRQDGSEYLEPHHTTRVADEGPDHPMHVIALCPNCHRRAHSSVDAKQFNERLIMKLLKLEVSK